MRRHVLIAFREPAAGETHHIEIIPIEIIPFEADTGRVVPNVPIRVEVKDDSGSSGAGRAAKGPRWPKAPPSRSTISSSNQRRKTVPVSAGGALLRAVRHDVRLSWEAAAG